MPNTWERHHAILTPGDRVEYKFKMAVGETIFAAASSDAFDPALEIDDANGKKLAENDDRAPGDQQPFLIFRSQAAGTYSLKVLSYRSVSGGSFDVAFRTFTSSDAGFKREMHDLTPDSSERTVFRISVHKGKFYDLGQLMDGERHRGIQYDPVRVVGPTGVESSDFERVQTQDNEFVFEAKADGDYYVEYSNATIRKIETNFVEVTATAIAPDSQQSIEIPPHEIRIYEFPVKPNLVVRTAIAGERIISRLSISSAEPNEGVTSAGDGYFNTPQLRRFKPTLIRTWMLSGHFTLTGLRGWRSEILMARPARSRSPIRPSCRFGKPDARPREPLTLARREFIFSNRLNPSS